MDWDQDHAVALVEALGDAESGTLLLVAGDAATVEAVARELGADLGSVVESDWDAGEDRTGWALRGVGGGVVGYEHTGYGDPALDALRALSALSPAGTAGVVRGNVDGTYRFGYARAGELAFDENECAFLDDLSQVPEEVRDLVELMTDDLDEGAPDDGPGDFAVGLAAVERVTGVRLDVGDVVALTEGPFHPAPSLGYAG